MANPGLVKISVRADLRRITRGLDDLAQRQVPFAAAQAINAIAAQVQQAETAHIKQVFPTATPFTLKSVRVRRANKAEPTAVVYLGDIAAAYLGPFIDGGRHHLNSRALLNPKAIAVNTYGNLPKSTLARLKGRADIFIGAVKTKGGEEIRGVWQRIKLPAPKHAAMVAKLGRGARRAVAAAIPAAPRTKLKLLIRFGDALPVEQHLDWGDTAAEIVSKGFDRAFAISFARAMATAKE